MGSMHADNVDISVHNGDTTGHIHVRPYQRHLACKSSLITVDNNVQGGKIILVVYILIRN